jgi:hypothetical protein
MDQTSQPVLGVTEAFGPRGQAPESSHRMMAARIAERRVGSNPEQ